MANVAEAQSVESAVAIDPRERAWIELFVGRLPELAEDEKRQQVQGKAVAEVNAELDNMRLMMVGVDFDLEIVKAGLFRNTHSFGEFIDKLKAGRIRDEKIKTKRKDRDAQKEMDSGRDSLDGIDALDEHQLENLKQSFNRLIAMSEKMAAAGYKPDQIAAEVWQPLVREGILPDNFVPDQYNETVQLFQGAAAEYDKALLEFSEDHDGVDEILTKAQNAVKMGGGVCEQVLAAMGPEFAAIRGVAVCTQVMIENGIALGQAGRKLFKGNDLEGGVDGGIDAVGKLIEFGLKPVDIAMKANGITTWEPISKKAGSAFLAVAKGGSAGAFLVKDVKSLMQEEDPAKRKQLALIATSKFFGRIGAAGEGVFQALDSSTSKADVGVSGEREGNSLGMFAAAGATFRTAANAGKASAKFTAALMREPPDYAAMVNAIQSVAEDVAQIGLEWSTFATNTEPALQQIALEAELSNPDEPPSDDRRLEIEIQLEVIKSAVAQAANGTEEEKQGKANLQQFSQLAESMKNDPASAKKFQQKLEEMEREAVQEEMNAAIEEFSGDLSNVLGMYADPEDQAQLKELQSSKIENLMAAIERDRAILKAAEGLIDAFSKGGAVVFRQMAMVSYGKDFAKNLIMAIKRIKELNDWLTIAKQAKKMGNVYDKAMMSRVDSSKLQIADRELNCAFELTKIIGNATYTVGQATAGAYGAGVAVMAVGTALEYGAGAAQTVKDMIFAAHEEKTVAKAWRDYQKIRTSPVKDRVQMRKQIRDNPTLAKFVIAYGAYVKNDPFAKEACDISGINEQTLRDPGTNCQKLVKFLELRFNEDYQVYNAIDDATLDEFRTDGGKAQLSLAGFVSNRHSAISKLKISTAGLESADQLLMLFEEAEADLKAMRADVQVADKELDKARRVFLPLKQQLEDGIEDEGDEDESLENRYEAALAAINQAIEGFNKTVPLGIARRLRDARETMLDLGKVFRTYQPVTTKGKVCEPFLRYVDQLKKLVEAKLNAIEQELEQTPDMPEPQEVSLLV